MIYIDASRYNNTDKKTGVENYSFHLINELIKQHPKEITLISPKKTGLNTPEVVIPFPRLWTQIRLSWEILTNRKIKTLFVPSHMLPLIHPEHSVITIHDTAWKHVPESYGKLSKLYLEWGTKFAIKNAKKIIAVSETTKKDLIKFYKADPEKIHVTPLGYYPPEVKTKQEEEIKLLAAYSLQRTAYNLFLGRIEHKKNTDTLIQAFEKFSRKNPNIKLVLVGSAGRGGEKIINNIPENLKKQIILTGYISETEKHVLMKNALCFIFPSRYEGFGIPLLEAMHYKLPIIASDIPASREVAEKNALFFDPPDIDKLAELIEKVSTDKTLRKKMTENHPQTLQKHSWQTCAKKTWKVISGCKLKIEN
jgi:glycosyltransferase involved in cell wall biosynthesis